MTDTATAAAPAPTTPPLAADPKAALPTAKAATPEATYDVKVNGQVRKLTQAQLVAAAQKGLFADQRLKSMDVLQGKTAALLSAMKTPEGILQVLKDPALGASPKDVFKKLMASDIVDDELKETMAKWVYDNVVVQGKKTPEQVEQEKRLAKLDQLEKADADRKLQEATTAQKAQVQQIYTAVRAEVTKQIVADKTFPQTEGSIRAVVEKLRVMNRKGAPITPENVTKALGLVKSDHLLHQQAMFDALEDPEALIAVVGEARALKISRALVDRLKKKQAAKADAKPAPENGVREKVTDRIDRKLGRTPQGYHVLDI